jgi:predicted nuclease of restriction endonuclease-like RecB superfamily
LRQVIGRSLEVLCLVEELGRPRMATECHESPPDYAGLDDMKKLTKEAVTELKAAMVKDIDALSKQHGKDHKKLDEGLAKVIKAHAALDKENRGEVEKLRKTVGEVVARMHGGAAPPAK